MRISDWSSYVCSSDLFADPVNGRIFKACGRLIDRGQIATPVTLKGVFDQDEALKEVGGAAYLVRLAASVVTVINAEDYGREIRECFRSEEHTSELQSLMRISSAGICLKKQNIKT